MPFRPFGAYIVLFNFRGLHPISVKLKLMINLLRGNFNLLDSPLERGDKGVCKFFATHTQPLFLEGSLKVTATGSLIYLVSCFLAERIFTFRCSRIKGNEEFRFIPPLKD